MLLLIHHGGSLLEIELTVYEGETAVELKLMLIVELFWVGRHSERTRL